jgi:glycosyltransferase involved in cell wall biosynthesis
MRILYLVGREVSYQRNDVLLRAFKRFSQVDVIAGGNAGGLVWRSLQVLLQAIPSLIAKKYDLIFVGFYGHLIMLPVGSSQRTPVLFDAFLSNFDTLCFDRRRFAPGSFPGRLAYWLDTMSCQLADRVLLDTIQHAQYFTETFRISAEKLTSIPVGCNEDIFHPLPKTTGDGCRILYYSSYMPLHGVDVVIRAAKLLLEERDLHFKLIGSGQEYESIRRLAEEWGLSNVTFEPPVPLEKLPGEIAAADICLGGHFGQSAKAKRVIPGKIYQILAMASPLIAADTPANATLLQHGETAYLCPTGDANALAEAILTLHRNSDLRERLAANGRERYIQRAGEAVITQKLHQIVNEMIRPA